MSFRIRGFLIHLSASVILAIATICLVFFVWYPSPLDQAIGVASIFFILLGVDVVIGPLLTLAVCKEGKKSLKYDLAVIILLQLGAFLYGLNTIASGRPVWIAFNTDRFDLVQAFEMNHKFRAQAKSEYQGLSFTGPKWIAVRIPEGPEKKTITEGLFLGVDTPKRADLYEPLDQQKKLIGEKALPLSELYKFNPADNVQKALSKWPEANAFVPLAGRVQSFSVLLKRETGEIIAVVDLQPWK